VVPSEDIVLAAAPPDRRGGRVIHPLGEKILKQCDGRTPLRRILRVLEGDWFEAYRALKKLLDAQLVHPLSVEEALREARNVLVFNEHEAATALYQSVLALHPGHAEARKKLQSLKRRTGTTRRRREDSIAREVKLGDVLKTVVEQTRTGTLTAEHEDSKLTLHVGTDRILLLTTGPRRGAYLGEMLEQCGFAKAKHVEKALTYQQKTDKRLGEILILQGVVTEDKLKYALREKVLADLHDLFAWAGAVIRFGDGSPPPALTDGEVPVTDLPGSGHALLKEALTREANWREIAKAVLSPRVVFQRLDTSMAKTGKTSQKNPVLHRVNGKRPVSEILRSLPGSDYAAYYDLTRMIKSQVVRPLTAEEAKKGGNEAYMFNEFKEAIALYEWALELNPDDDRVKANLERARSFLGS
jgi:tetratricopeptide (TPR) repeat protein